MSTTVVVGNADPIRAGVFALADPDLYRHSTNPRSFSISQCFKLKIKKVRLGYKIFNLNYFAKNGPDLDPYPELFQGRIWNKQFRIYGFEPIGEN